MIILEAAVLWWCVTAGVDPCTNGSFEMVRADGAPVDWEILGSGEIIEGDCRSGARALRLVRRPNDPAAETGLNRRWRHRSGEQGAMLDRLKGAMSFWYKAVSAVNADLTLLVIPMDATPVETAAGRAEFRIPAEHIGDGQWHQARLRYDYSRDERVRWVHFAARIQGQAGELLLDDIAYLEAAGPIPAVKNLRVIESEDAPGDRCSLSALIENRGDAAAELQVSLEGAEPLTVTPAHPLLIRLEPDKRERAWWELAGARTKQFSLAVRAVCDAGEATARLVLAPELVLENFGPAAPVGAVGKPIAFEAALKNNGYAIALAPAATFHFPDREVSVRGPDVPPGRTVTLRAEHRPHEETPALPVSVTVRAENMDELLSERAELVVGAAIDPTKPRGRFRAEAREKYAILENNRVQLCFRHNRFGFGTGELIAKTPAGWRTVALLPRLSRLVYRDSRGERIDTILWADASVAHMATNEARLCFNWSSQDADGAAWDAEIEFTLRRDRPIVHALYRVTCDRDRELLRFDGPMIYALDRDEAVFPGLEWLVGEEVSSSALDIRVGHPHQVRYVPHPNMVTIPAIGIHGKNGMVGLLWDQSQVWDGVHDRPAAVFASPDRFENQRAHLAGLQLPSAPEFLSMNAREAATPYILQAGKQLNLRCAVLADGRAKDALAAIDEWLAIYGLPEPTPLPHGSYEGEIAFSMQAYLDTLWEDDTKEWWTTKRGPAVLCYKARRPDFIADLLLGAIVSPDPDLRDRCRARAEEIAALTGHELRIDALRHPGRADLAMADSTTVGALLASRDEDGLWRFDADHEDPHVFKGFDYYDLGPDDAVEVGICAAKTFHVLRYARIAGDWAAYDAVENILEFMETFCVPRAAQVWEVPVHTPDILAAADAIDAYIEAYRFTGDRRWLEDAVAWGRRGLPFIYLWGLPEQPYLAGASIPVFGASWYQWSWFGNAVQWNGLRYANALLKLAEFDNQYPWRHIAELIIRSAVHQQQPEGEDAALWPDSISAIDASRSPWVFPPRFIIQAIGKLTGRDEDPRTVILGAGRDRIHVSAVADIREAAWAHNEVRFTLVYPEGEQGVALVSNVSRPASVYLDGARIDERQNIERGPEPSWRYDAGRAFLAIRISKDRETSVRIQGVKFRAVERLPQPLAEIRFEFDESMEGWTAWNDIAETRLRDGALVGAVNGPDPYLARTGLEISPGKYEAIGVRMKVTAGAWGQFYWMTTQEPHFSEDRVVRFELVADSAYHEYRIETGRHPAWAGQRIAGIRIDPGNGATSAQFAIDYLRGIPPENP